MIKTKHLLFTISLLMIVTTAFSQKGKGEIKLQITNLKNRNGALLLSLHNKAEGFPGDTTHSLLSRVVKITGDTVKYNLANLPFGEYAVAIFHDENSNYDLDRNLIGYPKEGVGLSNNVYKMMGPPEYEDARFILKTKQEVIVINMHYY